MTLHNRQALFFSPTGGTERVARVLADALGQALGLPCEVCDLTAPGSRQRGYAFGPDELVLLAVPVYAGRIPNKLLPDLSARLQGSDTPAVSVCVFGNRSPDEAVRELPLLLEANRFFVLGAAAFACRHAFSGKVGAGRPDDEDLAQMRCFANAVAVKLAEDAPPPLQLDRGGIGPYYTPLKEDGTPARFLKAKPVTDASRCTRCGLCAKACPMGSIDPATAEVVGVCIKCQACVQKCPAGAKRFEDADFLSHVAMLEQNCTKRAKNIIIL